MTVFIVNTFKAIILKKIGATPTLQFAPAVLIHRPDSRLPLTQYAISLRLVRALSLFAQVSRK